MGFQLYTAFESTNDAQQVFRQLLKVMSEPGHMLLVDAPRNTASSTIYDTTWAVAQTLMDADCKATLLPSMQEQKMIQSLQFFTDCTIEPVAKDANFVFLSVEELQDLSQFNSGTLAAPHESCTLIVQTPAITNDEQLMLSGPGIKTQRQLMIDGLTQGQVIELQTNHQRYPCGLDIIFCSPTHISALPRSTKISSTLPLKEIA